MDHDLTLVRGDVTLRPLRVEDAPAMFALLDEESWQGMSSPVATTVAECAVELAGLVEAPDVQAFAVEHRGGFVGRTALYGIVEGVRVDIGHTYYGPQARGTVVNPTAKLLLFTHAFEERGFARVGLRCDHRNVRSHRAIAALGARFEGTLRHFRPAADGSIADVDYFSVIPDEWPAVRERLVTRAARPD